MCCSVHAKKVTTAENTRILFMLVRAFFKKGGDAYL